MTGAEPKPEATRRRFKKRWVLVGLLLLVVIGVRIGGAAVSRKVLYPVNDTPLPEASSAGRGGAVVDIVEYRTGDDVALKGAFVRGAETPDKPTVVFFHGNGESAAGELPFAAMLASRLHVDVLVAEFRGYGGTQGEPSESGLYADGRAALAATGRASQDVVVAGWSLGTGVAVELAHDEAVHAVVLLAPFTSIPDAAGHLLDDPRLGEEMRQQFGDYAYLVGPVISIGRSPLRSFVIADHFDSGAKIGEIDAPVFVVHGDADEVVAPSMGQELARRARRGTFLGVAGGTHAVAYEAETLEAFRAALED